MTSGRRPPEPPCEPTREGRALTRSRSSMPVFAQAGRGEESMGLHGRTYGVPAPAEMARGGAA
eukprot:scaffold3135_cov352-Prasinococcus_capsulatus_cf.AAC.4